jgi:two-component system cell cycle sensor histidine kinase/response regulator CckA
MLLNRANGARADDGPFGIGAFGSTEEIFRALTSHTSMGVFVSDAEGACVYVNDRWCELAGITGEEALGEGWARALHPDDADRVRFEWAEAARGGSDAIIDYRFRRPDGRVSSVRGFATAVRDGHGGIVGWTGTCVDLTATSKRARQQQAVAEFGLRTLSERSGEALLQDAVETVATALEVEYASFLELQADGETMLLRSSFGWDLGDAEVVAALGGSGPATQALHTREPLVVDHRLEGTPELHEDFLKAHDVASSAAIVVRGNELPFGVLATHSTQRHAFGENDVFFLHSIANMLAAALAHTRTVESARQLAVIVESSNDAILSRTLSGTVTSWNAASERLFGYSADEVIGGSITILAPPAQEGELEAVNLLLQRGETIEQLEMTCLRKDGTTIQVASTVSPITDAAGRLLGASAISRDVSEERRAEAALSGSEARSRAMLESSLDGVITLDQEGAIVEFSPAAEVIFGHRREDVLGRRMSEILIPPALRERHEQGFARLLATGTAAILGKRVELSALRADGTEFPIELTVNAVQVEGPPLFTSFVRDISERRRQEAQLRRSEARYRDLFENATDLIATVDLESRFTDVNTAFAETLGYTREELIGRPLADVVPVESQEPLQNARRGKIEKEVEGTVYEHELIAKDGRRIEVEVASRLIVEDGEPVGTEAICRDVSERKQLEARLRQAQKMEAIGELAGGIAHDFNNLLTVINGNADRALALDDIKEIKNSLGAVLKAGSSAGALTRQLLAFSRRQVLRPRVVALAEVISTSHEVLDRLLGDHVVLETNVDSAVGNIRIDPNQVEQVLFNLAVNARDAMPGGGLLTIAAADTVVDETYAAARIDLEPGNYVALTFTDDGLGMDEETQNRIFDPFFTTKDDGNGLGLATVYGIVKQSGGNISVHSEPGIGTTFKLLFPRVDEPAETREPPATPSGALTGCETILVVEDNELVLKLTAEILESLGYTVITAGCPDDALELASTLTEPLDLILSDVMLPGRSGPELVALLQRTRPTTKSLLTSGYAPGLTSEPGQSGSNQPFLAKPFTTAELAEHVRQVLDS